MTKLLSNRAVVAAVVVLATGLAGCSEGGKKRQNVQRLEGVARVIDLEKNFVSMTVKDDKGNEHIVEGTIREDTVVSINGRSHKLEDIRPGDTVRVYGYREGEGDLTKLVATRVEVDRPRDADWKSTATPVAESKDVAEPKVEPVASKEIAQPQATETTAVQDEELKQQTADIIYAQIRIRMEEAIAQRAALLKAGRPRSDLDVREKEGIIMRARDLLLGAGEVVEDLDPPIVEDATKQDPNQKPKKDPGTP